MNQVNKVLLTRVNNSDQDLVTFNNFDHKETKHPTAVLMSIYEWAEHGTPEQITVTIEPGDTRNEVLSHNEARAVLGLPPIEDPQVTGDANGE